MKKNFLFSTITILSRLLSGIFIIFILARLFTLHDFGVYTYALVIGNLIATVVEYGYNTRLTKELAKDHRLISTYTTQTMIVKLIIFILLSLILSVYITFTNSNIEILAIQSIIFVSLAITLNSFIVHLLIPYKVIDKFAIESKYALINNISTFMVVCIVAYLSKNVLLTSISFFISKLIILAYISFKFNQVFSFKFKTFRILQELKKTMPYALMTIIGGMYLTIDTVIIKIYVSIEDIGLYRAGFNIILASAFITNIFNNVALPKLSSLKSKKELINSSSLMNRYIIFMGIVISVLILLLQEFIINILYGSTFLELLQFIPYIVGIVFLRYVGSIYGLLLTIADKQMIRVLFVTLTLFLIIFLDFLLVPSMKLEGAFLSMLIGHIFLIVLYIGFTFKEYKSILLFKTP